MHTGLECLETTLYGLGLTFDLSRAQLLGGASSLSPSGTLTHFPPIAANAHRACCVHGLAGVDTERRGSASEGCHLRSIPEAHVMEEKNQLLKVPLLTDTLAY